jgi:excisionase family DNA binding protein
VLLLSVEEAARALGIGRSKTYELISAGDLETVHIGRSTRVPVAALHDLLDRLREAGERSRMRHCTKGRAADRAVDAEAEGEGRTVTETGAQP